jgi:hypothetical protein
MAINTCRVGKYVYEYLRCNSRYGCSVKGKNMPTIAIEQMLLIEHVMPRMEVIVNATQRELKPDTASTPEKKQWMRELKHRKQTPPEFLMAADRQRINELEILIRRASEPTLAADTPDIAALALRLTNATLGVTSSWFSDPPPMRNANLKTLLQCVMVDAVTQHITGTTFALGIA